MAGTITASSVKHRPRGIVVLSGAFTTDASGDASRTKIGTAFGRIVAVEYDPATGGVATGADITISDDLGAALVTLTDAGTAARRLRPTAVVTGNTGAAITAATTATGVDRDIYVGGDVYLTVAQGGNAKSGTVKVIVEEGSPAPQV